MAGVPFNPLQASSLAGQDPLLAIHPARTARTNGERPETYADSHFAQLMSGINEGIGSLVGAKADLEAGVYNLGVLGLNTAFPPQQTLADQIAGIQPQPRFKPIVDPAFGSAMLKRLMADIGAIKPKTDDPTKQFVRRGGQEVGASIIPAMGVIGRAARPVTAALKEFTLAGGAGIGAATADQLAPDNPWAEFIGQILGTLSAEGATRLGSKLITPFPVKDPARLGAMEELRREGIDLSAGQQTGHIGLQNIEGGLAGAELVQLTQKQTEQFTEAVLKRIGISTNRATKDVLKTGNENLVAAFGDIGSRNDIQLADGRLGKQLGDAYQIYAKSTTEANRLPAIENFFIEAVMALKPNGGINVLDGSTYASLRTRVGQLARETADPKQNSVLMEIQRALDDAMERSLSKEDVGAFRWARAADRDFTIIEKAALQDPSGLISPKALQSAAVAGQGDLAKLADSGTMLMTPPSSAGTAPGTRQLLTTMPTIAGGYIGQRIGDLEGLRLEQRRQRRPAQPSPTLLVAQSCRIRGDDTWQTKYSMGHRPSLTASDRLAQCSRGRPARSARRATH